MKIFQAKLLPALVAALLISSCSPRLPNTIYKAYHLQWEVAQVGDSMMITAVNPLACPLVYQVKSSIDGIEAQLKAAFPTIIPAYDTSQVLIAVAGGAEEVKRSLQPYSFWAAQAEVKPDTSLRYVFPFPRGKSYGIMQAYNGRFSHQSDFSRYAIDFAMEIGDTVCAALDGVVVGLIDGNPDWAHGDDRIYRPYANYLRLYHGDETYTDYVHLKANSVMVALGDTVQAGQPIALSGYTGWATAPHLHFNAFRPKGDGSMEGIPIRFEQIRGVDLRKDMSVGH